MKAVMISIKPYWVFLIIAKAMGWGIKQHKKIEVRKNYPKAEDWNKVVKIYCSKDKKSFDKIPEKYRPAMSKFLGKVIGEFVCDRIDCVRNYGDCVDYYDCVASCMSAREIIDYATDKNGKFVYTYGWHISDLVVYDEPKELSEFKTFCKSYYEGDNCDDCKYFIDCRGYEYDESDCACNGLKPIERPPQSWQFVEEKE